MISQRIKGGKMTDSQFLKSVRMGYRDIFWDNLQYILEEYQPMTLGEVFRLSSIINKYQSEHVDQNIRHCFKPGC
jgi:hypothetical protein